MKTERRGAAMTLKELETEAFSEAEVEHLWVEEAERRNEQMEEGIVEGRSAEDVIRDARARLR